jgi:hypothetical protein
MQKSCRITPLQKRQPRHRAAKWTSHVAGAFEIMDHITTKLRRHDLSNGKQDYYFFCPGCGHAHPYRVPRWKFDGNVNEPTFTPSLRLFHYAMEKGGKIIEPRREVTDCHVNITNGKLFFHGDCAHKLRGQVDMVEFPADYQCD